MLKHGKVYIDKQFIMEKLDFDIDENNIHITNATYENGYVDISFVVSVENEDDLAEKTSTAENPRRQKL
jgi:hypothetical protein